MRFVRLRRPPGVHDRAPGSFVHADEARIDMGSSEEVIWALEREVNPDLEVVLCLDYDGEPVSKSRARFTKRGSKTFAYTPEKTKAAEERIALLARSQIRGAPDGEQAFGVFAKFFCGTWQRRDVDNMLKLVSDALTGVVWDDDSQVSEMAAAVQRGVDDPRTYVLVYRTNARRPPTRPCRVCQKPVRQHKSQPNNYCSKQCSYVGQQKRVTFACVQCGSEYWVKESAASKVKTPLCSQSCREKHTKITRPCGSCGKPVVRSRSEIRKHVFYCDHICRDADRTHCIHGHEYTPENTYMNAGKKNCRTCRTAASRRRRDRLKAEREANDAAG